MRRLRGRGGWLVRWLFRLMSEWDALRDMLGQRADCEQLSSYVESE